MKIEPYRAVLRLPGVRSLLLVAMLARLPVVASGITLTLHVVLDLDRGYGAAGLVGAAFTVGAAIGAPLLGRLVDRRGLRLMLVITTVTEAVYWAVAPALPYQVLLPTTLVAGLLAIPVFSVVRQSIAALVPEHQRRPAYSLDSMSVELSYMVGPAVAVLLITTVSARAAMIAVGVSTVASGIALFLLNPPTRSAVEQEEAAAVPVRRREWLRPRLVAMFVVAAATTLVLGATDVSVVAVLRDAGQVEWTGVVLSLWGSYSLVGGFVYGGVTRVLQPAMLMGLMSLLTIPVGLAGDWWWLCLVLIPAGLLCAPTLAATADEVSRLAPAAARGEAMGLYGSALTIGLAVSAPLAGTVIDALGPAWGFAATGLIGTTIALVVLPIQRRQRRRQPELGDADLARTVGAT
ncbi:MAG TPA: MFS transporter [Micromonosporaceae bacterium]|nr:MFS transporter [Micromonosporaceae bacterium]